MNPSASPLSRFLMSFAHAARGIADGLLTQRNLRIHAAITLIVIVAGIGARLDPWEWCAVILAMMIVWAAELLNTALEYLTDLASPQRHPLAGKAKDAAAGAVLATAIGAAAVGLIIFIPHL